MKVLILTFTFPPNADGVAEAARAMADGLAHRGWSVTVGTAFHSGRTDFHLKSGVSVYQFDVSGTANLRQGIKGEIKKFQDFVEQQNPDVLVCHYWDKWPTTLAQQLFTKLRGRKVLISHGYSTHLWQPAPKPPWGLGFWLGAQHMTLQLPMQMRQYDRIVVLSKKTDCGRFFDGLVAKLTRYSGLRVIPNGTDIEAMDKAPKDFRSRYGIPPGFLFLCVANYSQRKNQALALRAFRDIADRDASLCFIGSEINDYARELIQLETDFRKEAAFGRVFVLEKVPRPDVLSAYVSADAFVLSAKAETQPISLLEAMAARKPFISTDTGCVSELAGGLVVRSAREMTAAMSRLLNDTSLCAKLGDAGRASVEREFSGKAVLDAQHRLLLELIKKPH